MNASYAASFWAHTLMHKIISAYLRYPDLFIHGNIKPENIYIAQDDTVRIINGCLVDEGHNATNVFPLQFDFQQITPTRQEIDRKSLIACFGIIGNKYFRGAEA